MNETNGNLSNACDQTLVTLIIGEQQCSDEIRTLISHVRSNREAPDAENFQALCSLTRDVRERLLAAFELGRRVYQRSPGRIYSSDDAYKLVAHLAYLEQEHLALISLNAANEPLAVEIVTVGLADRAQIHPREIFVRAMNRRASRIILAHNHPSGSLTPSSEDRSVTARIREAGKLLGIELLDHLIVTKDGFAIVEAG